LLYFEINLLIDNIVDKDGLGSRLGIIIICVIIRENYKLKHFDLIVSLINILYLNRALPIPILVITNTKGNRFTIVATLHLFLPTGY